MHSYQKLNLKLFIDRKTNKVLYAEAGKDLVDFLLHTFPQPLGAAMHRLFDDGAFAGALPNLYASVAQDLTVRYLLKEFNTSAKSIYSCSMKDCKYISDLPTTICPDHGKHYKLDRYLLTYVAPSSTDMGGGFENGLVMVTDDLVVEPLSTSAVMMLLARLGIKDFSCIRETQVTLDSDQAKASLSSKTVLTDTFLPLKTEK